MKRRNAYRPPARPEPISPEDRAADLAEALESLTAAWAALVAAGRLTDAAEVQKILRRRLDQAAEVGSPPASAAVGRRREIAEDPKPREGVYGTTPCAVTLSPAALCIGDGGSDFYCRLPNGHPGEHDLRWEPPFEFSLP